LPTLFVPMTGAAEQGRQVLPDPASPTIANGGFEQVVRNAGEVSSNLIGPDKKPPVKPTPGKELAKPAAKLDPLEEKPAGWHYQRQLQLITADDAPEGEHYVLFSNTEPGRASRALQGLAVDGRKVGELEISLQVRAKDIRQGPTADELPVLGIMFYDEKRALLPGSSWAAGPWRDSFDWKKETERIKVPLHAREAIVRIGLHGATGELSLDDIQMTAVKRK
jgi:protein-L-isoaspartate(D-aspartate) O-methyltransferase